MSTQAEQTAIRTSIVVEAPLERAFAVFVEDFDRIKPREHNMLSVDIAETVFEPRERPHLRPRGRRQRVPLGARPRVRAARPCRVQLDISPHWQLESDPERASEVKVRFITETPERTRVELEHRELDRHGEGWEGLRAGVEAPEGWQLYLNRYADAVTRG